MFLIFTSFYLWLYPILVFLFLLLNIYDCWKLSFDETNACVKVNSI